MNDYKRNPNWKRNILEYKLACKNCDECLFCSVCGSLKNYGSEDFPLIIGVMAPIDLRKHTLLNCLCDGNKKVVDKITIVVYEKETKSERYIERGNG